VAAAGYNRGMGESGEQLAVAAAAVLGLAAAPLLRRAAAAFVDMPPGRVSTAASAAGALSLLAAFAPRELVVLLVLTPLCLAGVVLAHVDVAQRWLPDAVVLPAYPLTGATLICGGIAAADPDRLLTAAGAAAACLAGYGALCLATGGLGYGDVKLGGLLGLALGWIGWQAAALAALLAFAVGAAQGLCVLACGRRDTSIPFGPAMLSGALAAAALS
ncbi:MAG: prepilin peptidase, partial [Stackebrandtia sp.]